MYPTDVPHLHGFCTFSVPHLKIVVSHLKLEQLATLVQTFLFNVADRCISIVFYKIFDRSFKRGKFYHEDTKMTKYQRNIGEVQRFEMKFLAFEEKRFVEKELNLFIAESIKFF